MTTATASERLIPLRDGPAVPEHVVLWLLAAEDRGLRFKVDGELVRVGPRQTVHDDDLAFIKTHKVAVLACLKYIDMVVQRPL